MAAQSESAAGRARKGAETGRASAGHGSEIVLEAKDIGKAFGERQVLERIAFQVKRGEWLGILGPNGSGKSTLLHILSGVEMPTAGQALLAGKPLAAYSRKELARFVAVLSQDALPPLGFTVREIIEMGRYPYQNWFGDETGEAGGLVERIIERLKLGPLSDRTVNKLSGGERQRVALGKVMAQEPRLLLLDEPTTFLDIGYQLEMMELIRTWQQEGGLTVVSVLHDLNLAAQFCDRLMLVSRGRIAGMGAPHDVIEARLLSEVYGTEPHVLPHPGSGVPQILLGKGKRS